MTAIRTILSVITAAMFWRLLERSYRRQAKRVKRASVKKPRPHEDWRLTNL